MSTRHLTSKVFGIGISRTGTTSLSKALRRLGYDTIHAPLSIIKRVDGRIVLNEEAVRRYEALTDSTVAFMYKELDAAFPGANFILTVRDVEKWLLSMRRVRKVRPLVRLIPKTLATYQPLVAHAAIDAGADLIIGHHPHVPKAVEIYKGKVCFYSISYKDR